MGGWNFIDKTNMRFDKLVAKEYLGNGYWLCECDCGNETIVHSNQISLSKKRRNTKSCGCAIGKLNKNNNFFKELNTEEKAYITGLLCADGNITDSDKSYSINLALKSDDKEILEKIKKAMDSKSEIKIKKGKSKLPQNGEMVDYELAVLRIHNKQMVKDLESYGITPKKSLTLNFNYSKLPNELFSHFLRGLIDGDGCFNHYYRQERNHYDFGLISSKAMILSTAEKIKEFFPDMKIRTLQAIGCNELTWRLKIERKNDFIQILNFMYNNATIYLDRKYQNYLRLSRDVF